MSTPKIVRRGDSDVLFHPSEVLAGLYEIRGVLGGGGMGQVLEARDLALDRRVAIKAAWPHIPATLLHQEARALAAFNHPALPTVHATGVHRGVDFIVMERIYGVSLEDHLAHRAGQADQFTIPHALWLMRKIAEGLAVVHLAGIAHRDIKPANIMLTPDRRVVLMDLGLMLPEVALRFGSNIAGSPAYMAPEAIDNKVAPGAGQLVDIYALGVTGYELLTGCLPFNGENLDVIRVQQMMTIPSVQELRPQVPDELAALILEMLAPDPGKRPQSAESVAWQLRNMTERKRAVVKTGPVRVLVVDDEEAIAKLLAIIAKQAIDHAEVVVVHHGEAALKELRQSPPDIMLLDIHMPNVNGIEVCMYMRGADVAPDCVVIAVSAGAQDEDRQLLQHLGITDFITKGRDLRAQVTAALQKACAQRHPSRLERTSTPDQP